VLRIVDVAGALSRRGYPPGLQAELHLDVHDDLLTHNTGRWQLSVAEGRAEVRPGGAGRIKLGIRELAALYTGHLSPAALQFSGALSGSDEDLALLALVFSGEPPRLTDPF
jgi:predicted acetyltransferase